MGEQKIMYEQKIKEIDEQIEKLRTVVKSNPCLPKQKYEDSLFLIQRLILAKEKILLKKDQEETERNKFLLQFEQAYAKLQADDIGQATKREELLKSTEEVYEIKFNNEVNSSNIDILMEAEEAMVVTKIFTEGLRLDRRTVIQDGIDEIEKMSECLTQEAKKPFSK